MLLDLPDAVLTAICRQLPDECIFAAALSCHRLNELALRVFLSRNDIPDPLRQCDVYLEGQGVERTALGLLHALNLATLSFLKSTKTLSFIFLNADLSLGLRDLAQAASLVNRLSPIQHVSLEFRGTICENRIEMSTSIQRRWNSGFLDLWSAVLSNQTVSTLSIRTKWDFLQSYKLYDSPSRIRDVSSARLTRAQSILRSTWRRLRPIPSHTSPSSSVQRALPSPPTITAFHIESSLILHPAFYQMTLFTLRCSPITSLKLHSVPELIKRRNTKGPNLSEDIVNALPFLTSLTIANMELETTVLCRFLSKFPQLTNLTIEPPGQYSYFQSTTRLVPPLPRDVPRLALLNELSVGSGYLVAFLQRPNFLARIARLHITIPMGDLLLPSLLNDLAPIKRSPPAQMSLSLDKFNLLASAIWAMENCIDVSLGLGNKWKDVFSRVKDLTLVRTHYPALHESPVFRRWLALFPAAKKVTWDEYSSDDYPVVFSKQRIYASEDVHETKESKSNNTQFMDFPDDILISILELLTDELFDVALVCRRLNYLTIPIFLMASNIWNRTTHCCVIKLNSYPIARDHLAALSIALVLPHIEEVWVDIPRSGYIYPSLNHVQRLIPVLKRIDMVKKVSLRFGVAPKMHLEEHHIHLQYRWCSLFQELLNVVVNKETCTTLHIRGSPYLFPDEIRWNQRRHTQLKQHVLLDLPTQTNLTHISFEPAAMLSPIFEPWTTSVLQNSKLDSLRLDVTMEDYRFVEIISQALPHLRELEIRWLISPEKNLRIATFLSRLTKLESLRMSSVFTDLTSAQPIPLAIPHLPHLTTLNASIPYINHLLRWVPHALPSLQQLEISTLLSSSSTRPSTAIGSLETLFEGLRRHNLSPRITLAVNFRTTWERDAHWPRNAFDSVLGVGWVQWCPTISALKVKVTSPYSRLANWDSNAAYVSFLRERLTMFPALTEVSFVDGIEYKTETEMMGMASVIVQTVKATHPTMGSIWVNRKRLL
ncbi:hypothetical protein MIND_00171600 [Mycena indigotica]|uniref:F-box domain-containing protein n=1 Tax=Mycena indigotica TaxID=2126181 RepID=A0A8H6TF17_9AGAR|nr:uncharacterized protein MIND_00171600 [Mycena indigotica]KAF7316523.1 hypothetical protein MIND_00171600 [Mycena indigotica]